MVPSQKEIDDIVTQEVEAAGGQVLHSGPELSSIDGWVSGYAIIALLPAPLGGITESLARLMVHPGDPDADRRPIIDLFVWTRNGWSRFMCGEIFTSKRVEGMLLTHRAAFGLYPPEEG